MIRFIAAIGVLVAVAFVGYSAITLYQTGYNITSLEWQKQLYGGAAAAVVVYEALAILFAIALWKEKHRGLAAGCLILLVAATAWSFRLELLNQVAGQADRIASRQNVITQSGYDAGQLAALSKQQATWTAKIETATGKALAEFRAELDKINAQIREVIARINERPAVAEASPDASLAARLLGGSEVQWRDWLAILSLAFWPLARILATPAAVEFWRIATRQKSERPARDWTKAESYMDVTAVIEAETEPSNVPPFEAPKDTRSLEEIVRGVVQSMPAGKVSLEDIWARVNDELLNANRSPVRDGVVTGILTTLKVEKSPTRDSKSTFYTIKKASGRGRKEPALSLAKAA